MGALGETYMSVLVIRAGDAGSGCGCPDWAVLDCRKGSPAEVGPTSDFGFLDDFSREAQTWRQDSVAFDLHDDVVDDLINGIAVGNQAPEDARQ